MRAGEGAWINDNRGTRHVRPIFSQFPTPPQDDKGNFGLHGTDETFATRVSARRSYRSDRIVWGAKFRDVIAVPARDGRASVDLTVLDLHDDVV